MFKFILLLQKLLNFFQVFESLFNKRDRYILEQEIKSLKDEIKKFKRKEENG